MGSNFFQLEREKVNSVKINCENKERKGLFSKFGFLLLPLGSETFVCWIVGVGLAAAKFSREND